jgi:hypothetical protein
MAKTVSSAGLQDFIATGQPTKIWPNDPKEVKKVAAEQANPPEVPRGTSPESAAEAPKAAETPISAPADPEEGLETEDKDLPERARKRIGRKHYQMKQAQEEAEFNSRLAEQQFNERRLIEQERDQLKAELAKVKPATPAPELTKPKPDDFLDENKQFKAIEYAEALADYSAKKALADDRKEQAERQAKATGEAQAAAFTARLSAAKGKYPDFEERLAATPVQLQNQALQYIAESEYGTDLAYYLADPANKADADRIKAMHPLRAIAELGKLETRFEKSAAPATPEKTNGVAPKAASPTVERAGAPAPITPIASSGSVVVNTDPAKMNFKELRAYEREREAAKHRH